MSDIKIQPSATGSATVTLTAPVTNTARTITFPDSTSTLLASDGSAANLTAIPAANITGTLPALAATNLTSIPAANITGTLPAISGASLTGFTSSQMPTGSVIQVVSADIGALTTSSAQSWVDTNASIAITPQFASSKIMATFTFALAIWGQARARGGYQLLRGSTVISGGATEVIQIREVSGGQEVTLPISLSYLDSPNSTSATTYKIQIYATSSGGSIQMLGQGNTRPGNMILMEIKG